MQVRSVSLPRHRTSVKLLVQAVLSVLFVLAVSSANADVNLSDTDVERITELAATLVPGQISAISPRDGRYYGYTSNDGNVDGFVYLSIQTKTGNRGLIVARISGAWRVPNSEREKLEVSKYRMSWQRLELPLEVESKQSQRHKRERKRAASNIRVASSRAPAPGG